MDVDNPASRPMVEKVLSPGVGTGQLFAIKLLSFLGKPTLRR